MIAWLIRDLLLGAWVAGLLGSWRLLRIFVLPVMLDRCPWAQGIDGP